MNMNNPMNNNHTNTTHNNTNPNIPRSAGSAGGDGYVTPSQVPAELSSLFHSLARELPALVSQLPESVRAFLPRAELDLAATLAATRAANSAAAATRDVPMPEGFAPVAGCHPGVRCDRTGECPIRGNRYNLIGRNYDLCESEFLKLSESEKALYVKIPPPPAPPVHTMEPPPPNSGASGMAAVGFHPGVECDRS